MLTWEETKDLNITKKTNLLKALSIYEQSDYGRVGEHCFDS